MLRNSHRWCLLGALLASILLQTRGNAIDFLDSCDDHINAYDRAKLTVLPNAQAAGYTVWAVNEDCYKCAKTWLAEINAENSSCLSMWTPFEWKFYLQDGAGHQYETKYTFGDQGHYSAVVPTNVFALTFDETDAPIDPLVPLYILLGILFACFVVFFVVPLARSAYRDRSSFYTTHSSHSSSSQSRRDDGSHLSSRSRSQPSRLRSLDTFRGFSLVMMIFVNYGGGGYWFFNHAAWNGLTVADLLFPWFMWIMGVSMAFSFRSTLASLPTDTTPRVVYTSPAFRSAIRRVCLRSAKLFLLGLFLNNGYDYTTWRIPGVLQYFAFSYLVVSVTMLGCYPYTRRLAEASLASRRMAAQRPYALISALEDLAENHPSMEEPLSPSYPSSSSSPSSLPPPSSLSSRIASWCSPSLTDWTVYRHELAVMGLLLAVYLAVVFGGQAPGCPRGYNGPGGIGSEGDHVDCTGGIHRYLDVLLFTNAHFYQTPICQSLYQCGSYDPEGGLGSLTATLLTYLGLCTGRVLLQAAPPRQCTAVLVGLAGLLLLLAGCLCGFSQNEGVLPVNKNLWSLSFVCLCAGGGQLGLLACYWLVDVWQIWSGNPFLALGKNSILVYACHEVLADYLPFSFVIFRASHALELASNVVGALSWVVIASYWERRGFYVKL